MSWKSSVAATFLLALLTSCVAANNAKEARYVAELEPPSQYNHPYYDGPVEERVLPVAEVRVLCDSLGASHSSADASAPGGTAACAWVSDDICFIILPDDELASVDITVGTKLPIAMVGLQIIPTLADEVRVIHWFTPHDRSGREILSVLPI